MSELDTVIRAIREDAYEDGNNGAGHPASIEKDKQQIKDLVQELVDTTFDKDDTKAYEFWKKFEQL